jgi:hypothetical protein
MANGKWKISIYRLPFAIFRLAYPTWAWQQITNSAKADTLRQKSGQGRQGIMNKGEQKKHPPTPPLDNSVSDSTGQYDLRFVLWRQFCAEYNVPVDTLPSQLDDDQKDRWEEMKARRLK